MTKEERDALIERYASGTAEVVSSLEGFPPDKLTTRAFPGKWSAAEIVHHLADSEMTSAIRLRRLLAEERPVIHGYDQEAFATRLRYAGRDISARAGRASQRPRNHPSAPQIHVGRGVARGWLAHRDRALHGRALAGDLRRARPRARGADSTPACGTLQELRPIFRPCRTARPISGRRPPASRGEPRTRAGNPWPW